MAEASHLSDRDCMIHTFKERLGDHEFHNVFGKTKEEIGNCDLVDRNSPEEQEADLEHLGDPEYESKKNQNFPKADIAITQAGDNLMPACANHAQMIRDSQVRAEINLGHVRPSLNKGESNEVHWRMAHRTGHLIEKANKYWDSMIHKRNVGKFNSGTPEDRDLGDTIMYAHNDPAPDYDLSSDVDDELDLD